MKPIEPAKLESTPGMVGKVSDFWSRNVNAERLMGRAVSGEQRGIETYFEDLETQRYRSHRHLPHWIESMRPGSQVLEDFPADFAFDEGSGQLSQWTPSPTYHAFSRMVGWHLMIRATR